MNPTVVRYAGALGVATNVVHRYHDDLIAAPSPPSGSGRKSGDSARHGAVIYKKRSTRAWAATAQTAGQVDNLNAAAVPEQAGKFCACVQRLKESVSWANSPTPAVVFAERVATLTWLRDHLPSATGPSADNIAMLARRTVQGPAAGNRRQLETASRCRR